MSLKKQIKWFIPNILRHINKLSGDYLDRWRDPVLFKHKKSLAKTLTKVLYRHDPECFSSPYDDEYSNEAEKLADAFCNTFIQNKKDVADIITAVFFLAFGGSKIDFSIAKNSKMLDEIFSIVKSRKEDLYKSHAEQHKNWK